MPYRDVAFTKVLGIIWGISSQKNRTHLMWGIPAEVGVSDARMPRVLCWVTGDDR